MDNLDKAMEEAYEILMDEFSERLITRPPTYEEVYDLALLILDQNYEV